ncbi:Hypothetical protein BQ3484_49 [Cedratvirus A11]|uniref:Uncharacterized protein n=1 Tax=Cedratvirus A11 TaxID=1903266 RepID=A0A1M7XTV5_9VIRU|nr:Hypothetical protein BQ3484_49 [Cedratvirus A11]SHO33117.1 Hypothetical protein BQ3484_49 [Cedratvirus A11]
MLGYSRIYSDKRHSREKSKNSRKFYQDTGLCQGQSPPTPPVVAKVSDVDWNTVKPLRAGVIVYTLYTPCSLEKNPKNKLLFCMGVDRKTSEITDFGGGVSYKKDKTTAAGALREFTEESLGVFGKFYPSSLDNCVVVYNNNMAIFFLPLVCSPEDITHTFSERYRKERSNEVSSLAWMDKKGFLRCLFAEKIFYVRVSKLLQPVIKEVLEML